MSRKKAVSTTEVDRHPRGSFYTPFPTFELLDIGVQHFTILIGLSFLTGGDLSPGQKSGNWSTQFMRDTGGKIG
ncbi:MAG: hypothetical protein ACI9ZF_002884 [Bradyrhizobium sp.]|jgi:hypothetical protein